MRMSTEPLPPAADPVMALVHAIRTQTSPLQPEPTGVEPRLMELRDIRAVLFDVYGTLLVSASGDVGPAAAAASERAFEEALVAAGVGRVGADSARGGAARLEGAIRAEHAASRGAGVEYPEVDILQVWQRVLSSLPGSLNGLDPAQLQRLAVEYECRVNPAWPMLGAEQTLRALRTVGLPLGIVSNAQFYTPLLLQALFGAPVAALGFHPPLCAFSYRALQAKPSPQLFVPVLQRLERGYGIQAGAVLYVGNDRLKDIWPAAALGCRTALFAGDARSLRWREGDARCVGVEPDVVITDLRQIAAVIG